MNHHIPIRSTIGCVVVLAAMAGVAGCGGVGDALGVAKQPPDEFAVVTKAPLVVPPDFRLRPPRPGTPRPQEQNAQALAVEALFPGREELPPPSRGQQALLREAGAANAGSAIRSMVNDDVTSVVPKGELTSDLLNAEIRTSDIARLERLNSSSSR